MDQRKCIRCNVTITACFGFVLVRDLILAQDGLIPFNKVREHCGRCVLYFDIHPEETKEYLSKL